MDINYCLRRGEEADYADLLDFGNYVFKIDFRSLLPKLYGNHPELGRSCTGDRTWLMWRTHPGNGGLL